MLDGTSSNGTDTGIDSSNSDNGSMDSASDVNMTVGDSIDATTAPVTTGLDDNTLATTTATVTTVTPTESVDDTTGTGVASPEVASPDVASPEVASPEGASVEADDFRNKVNFGEIITMKQNIPYLILMIIGIITTVIGVPFIIYKILKYQKTLQNEADGVNDDSADENDDDINDVSNAVSSNASNTPTKDSNNSKDEIVMPENVTNGANVDDTDVKKGENNFVDV